MTLTPTFAPSGTGAPPVSCRLLIVICARWAPLSAYTSDGLTEMTALACASNWIETLAIVRIESTAPDWLAATSCTTAVFCPVAADTFCAEYSNTICPFWTAKSLRDPVDAAPPMIDPPAELIQLLPFDV